MAAEDKHAVIETDEGHEAGGMAGAQAFVFESSHPDFCLTGGEAFALVM